MVQLNYYLVYLLKHSTSADIGYYLLASNEGSYQINIDYCIYLEYCLIGTLPEKIILNKKSGSISILAIMIS